MVHTLTGKECTVVSKSIVLDESKPDEDRMIRVQFEDRDYTTFVYAKDLIRM